MRQENLRVIYDELRFLSFLAMGRTSPNPPVAACITSSEGKIFALGNTQITGKNHAEREAYSHMENPSSDHQLFVSLEPCTHEGRTPPCRDLVLSKKPKQLKIGWKDPNPLVHSGDWEVYKKENVSVSLDPSLARLSIPFLFGFFQRIQKQKPWVWIKSAVNERGEYSPSEERRVSVSSQSSSYYLQFLRAKFDAVVVGPKTISIDEPSLDFRISESSFLQKGHPASISSPNPFSFFSPGNGLLKSIFDFSPLVDVYLKHLDPSYQPYRVFVYGDKQKFSSEFLQKQLDLNQKYGKNLCLFFRVLSDSSSGKTEGEFLDFDFSRLSDFPVEEFKASEGNLFLNSLASKGINTVLLESGSFLYRFVQTYLEEEDCILTIAGKPDSDWGKGKVFAGFHSGKEVAKYKIGDDEWTLRNFSGSNDLIE